MSAAVEETPRRRRVLYGRRQGPKLRPHHRQLLETLLPEVGVTIEPGVTIDPFALFPERPRAVWLEVGFGGGEHLAAQAAAHPEIGFVGVEPFRNGAAKLLAAIEAKALRNVRILMDDARLLLAALADATIDRAFILFPDPWPKARHRKRRIVNAATVAELARVMPAGGELRLATDDMDYARWMLAAVLNDGRFAWLAERADDWRVRPPDWPPTRYEEKAVAGGRRPVFLRFRRRGPH